MAICQYCHKYQSCYLCYNCGEHFCHYCGVIVPGLLERRRIQLVICPLCLESIKVGQSRFEYPACSKCGSRNYILIHPPGCGENVCRDCSFSDPQRCKYQCRIKGLCKKCAIKIKGFDNYTGRIRTMAYECPECGAVLL